MPAETPCHHCGRVGFVRFETVVKKGEAYRHYYCGACDRTWQIEDAPTAPPDPPDSKPNRPLKRSE